MTADGHVDIEAYVMPNVVQFEHDLIDADRVGMNDLLDFIGYNVIPRDHPRRFENGRSSTAGS